LFKVFDSKKVRKKKIEEYQKAQHQQEEDEDAGPLQALNAPSG
jgi:hypothetical protein